jgi:hypothetical protein
MFTQAVPNVGELSLNSRSVYVLKIAEALNSKDGFEPVE